MISDIISGTSDALVLTEKQIFLSLMLRCFLFGSHKLTVSLSIKFFAITTFYSDLNNFVMVSIEEEENISTPMTWFSPESVLTCEFLQERKVELVWAHHKCQQSYQCHIAKFMFFWKRSEAGMLISVVALIWQRLTTILL